MDDGLGFAIGSLIGGLLYKNVGGKASFRIFATMAIVTCFAHIILRPHRKDSPELKSNRGVNINGDYRSPVDQELEEVRAVEIDKNDVRNGTADEPILRNLK